MKKILFILTLATTRAVFGAESNFAFGDPPIALFANKTLVSPHIYVESLSQFSKWSGAAISQGKYEGSFFEKVRIGAVAFGPGLSVYVDLIANRVDAPSYYELVNASTGAIIGTYEIYAPDRADWYFAGNGIAYLNQTHLSLCGPRYTRKIVQKSKTLQESRQPLLYLGIESNVVETLQLFESPGSDTVVATLTPPTKAFIIGIRPGKADGYNMALLIKTPLGLTGWHVINEKHTSRGLDTYMCN